MQEIEFLATLLLNDNLDKEIKTTIINRIISLSKAPAYAPAITYPTNPYIQHQWTYTTSPHCDTWSAGITHTTGLASPAHTADSESLFYMPNYKPKV